MSMLYFKEHAFRSEFLALKEPLFGFTEQFVYI